MQKDFDDIKPERVLINEEGDGLLYSTARDMGIQVDVVFFRFDGWSLGSPKSVEKVAYDLWETQWVSFWRRGWTERKPISEYKPL